MIEFLSWVNGTPLSLLFKTNSWVVPAAQAVHIIAVGIILSAFVMLTMRGVGVTAAGVAIRLLNARFLPWVWGSLAVMVVTGTVQIIAEPTRALPNPYFQVKMLFLAAVVAMLAAYQASVRRDPDFWDGHALFPPRVRALSFVLVLLTLGMIFCGRWIAYAEVASDV